MKFSLDEVSSFSEEQLKDLMKELEKNNLILIPHYLLRSDIFELFPHLKERFNKETSINKILDEEEDFNDVEYLEIKDKIQKQLCLRIEDSLKHNLEDW